MNIKKGVAKRIASAIREVRRIGPVRGLFFMLVAAVTAMACGWSYITDHSVRFNSYRTGRGFYRLPPLPIMYDSKTGKELTVTEIENMQYDEEESDGVAESARSDSLTPTPSDIWQRANEAEQKENLAQTQALLQKFLDLTVYPAIDDSEEEQKKQQGYRNSAYDMLDALTASKQGSSVRSIKAYLDARYAYDTDSTENVEAMIANAPRDKNLQDNWDYLHAALLSETEAKMDALNAFRQHAAKYPHSEKNEAVLYMAAKLTMQLSYSFEKSGCGIGDKDEWGKQIDAAKIEPVEKCQDENWHAAVRAFQQLMQTYPDGRYFNNARGWLAYLYRRGGERAKALADYYRLLGDPNDRSARLEAKKSLQIIGDEYDDATLDKVEELIAGDRNTAMAYAYYRIYNYSTDLTYQKTDRWYYNDEDEQSKEEKRIADEHNSGNHELDRIVRFATAMLKRYPLAKISGGFALRIAEAQLELQHYTDALNLSKRALGLGLHDDLRAQALWVKGSAEHQRKDLKAARATFNQLIAEFPKSNLTEGARRLLAMTAEDQDDLESALEQYLALHYDYDVAYFVDVLLPTDRLAKFVSSHEQIPEHNQLLYALSVRYMRDERWNDARATFQRVVTKPGKSAEDWEFGENDGRSSFPKEPDWDWNEKSYLKSSWVMQDLKTIDALEYLEKAVDATQGDDAKAEALYQLASYQFDANSLLFYNPAAWRGQRYELLSQLNDSDSMRLPGESQNLFSYSQSHETLARAIPIYLEVVERYPQTKAAKDALFSAAVAHERLSDLNPYWSEIYRSGLFAGQKLVTFGDIARSYPHFRWPISRVGWEAATRTVNCGPGWAAPPKPAPKLTRTQKIERVLTRVGNEFLTMIRPKIDVVLDATTSFLRGCFYGLLMIVGMLIVGVASALYFWKIRAPHREISQLLLTESSLEELPSSESRLANVIETD
jgi:outer membrane protein assembly factor BamD (BamD/ComL family)